MKCRDGFHGSNELFKANYDNIFKKEENVGTVFKLRKGMKFGSLTLISRVEDADQAAECRPQWLCACTCGAVLKVVNRNLTRPMYPTCGRKECKEGSRK